MFSTSHKQTIRDTSPVNFSYRSECVAPQKSIQKPSTHLLQRSECKEAGIAAHQEHARVSAIKTGTEGSED